VVIDSSEYILFALVVCAVSARASFFRCCHPARPSVYTLSLHDALPISMVTVVLAALTSAIWTLPVMSQWLNSTPSREGVEFSHRSEEHTSELQSRFDLVCRLLLEKKKQLRMNPTRMN